MDETQSLLNLFLELDSAIHDLELRDVGELLAEPEYSKLLGRLEGLRHARGMLGRALVDAAEQRTRENL